MIEWLVRKTVGGGYVFAAVTLLVVVGVAEPSPPGAANAGARPAPDGGFAAQQSPSAPAEVFVWPIADRQGAVVLGFGLVPHPKTGETYFNSGYYIAAPAGSNVVAVRDGTISSVSEYSWQSGDQRGSGTFQARPTEADLAKYGVTAADVHGVVGLDLGNDLQVWYRGLTIAPGLKKGQLVKAGTVLGQVLGIANLFDRPVIRVSGTNPRPVDLGPYLFAKNRVAGPGSRIEGVRAGESQLVRRSARELQ